MINLTKDEKVKNSQFGEICPLHNCYPSGNIVFCQYKIMWSVHTFLVNLVLTEWREEVPSGTNDNVVFFDWQFNIDRVLWWSCKVSLFLTLANQLVWLNLPGFNHRYLINCSSFCSSLGYGEAEKFQNAHMF